MDNIVGIAVTGDDRGYWLAGSTGHVYSLGDAPPVGSPATSSPIVGIAADASSQGGWLVAKNGSVYPFGDAASFGTLPQAGDLGRQHRLDRPHPERQRLLGHRRRRPGVRLRRRHLPGHTALAGGGRGRCGRRGADRLNRALRPDVVGQAAAASARASRAPGATRVGVDEQAAHHGGQGQGSRRPVRWRMAKPCTVARASSPAPPGWAHQVGGRGGGGDGVQAGPCRWRHRSAARCWWPPR